MIIATRNGKRYESTAEDLVRVKVLFLENGGDLMKAIKDQFEEKYGEPFGPFDEVCIAAETEVLVK